MWKLALIYDSGKRFVIPFDIVEQYVDEQTLAKIKAKALKEIQKNG